VTTAEYKVIFDGEPASREQLDRIETVTVIQEADRPWQARLELSVCLDDQGSWTGDDEAFMEVLARVRVEVKVGDGEFVPLIDGLVVGFDSDRRAVPGQSTVTIVVHDDSVLLNKTAAPETFAPGKTDAEIANQILGAYFKDLKVKDTPGPPAKLPPEERRRGTHMQLLRRLARRNDFACGVLPGAKAGASIGVFHPRPVLTEKPPALVLLGPQRNIESFDVQLNAQRQSNVIASTLSFSDKTTVTRRSQVRNLQLIGQEAALASDADVGEERLPPGAGEGVELQHRVDREASRTSRVFEATGSVRRGCYAGVLAPLRPVDVQLGTTKTSGTYLIERVTHRLGRSEYWQEFTLVSDSLSSAGAGSSLIPAGLF
jgi:hypothetical protein